MDPPITQNDKMDPDYASFTSVLKHNEDQDKKLNAQKLRQIIDEEYTREIALRHTQVEQIELQIGRVRKLLHYLRYALVTSYYKRKQFESVVTHREDENGGQVRIHPAVKKLLGRNSPQSLEHLLAMQSNKRKSAPGREEGGAEPAAKRARLVEAAPAGVKREAVESGGDTFRQKNKYRVVIGNISKWMPSSEEDVLTHRWMVYVRGPKDHPDISHFVDKVVFYLHPSYKPYDVVEVAQPPFHLSRRGWGEFPVRARIFFTVTLNKPIDVVHNLKLDRSCTGRQTLGNETLIDVFLYESGGGKNAASDHSPGAGDDDERDRQRDDNTWFVVRTINSDHDYCDRSGGGVAVVKREPVDDPHNPFVHGVDNYEQKLLALCKFNRSNGGRSVVIGPKSVGSDPSFARICEAVLPSNRFKNMGEALLHAFNRLPMYRGRDSGATVDGYPLNFMARSREDFLGWNVGKRCSAEWCRARLIKNMAVHTKIHRADQWTTKSILMFGRSHLFVPLISSASLFYRDSPEKRLLLTCFSSSGRLTRAGNTAIKTETSDDSLDINVVDCESESSPLKKEIVKKIDVMSDPRWANECKFVHHTSRMQLQLEQLEKGVFFNGAERMILEAVKCLSENIIRRAHNHHVCRNTNLDDSSPALISKDDVQVALQERAEIMKMMMKSRSSGGFI